MNIKTFGQITREDISLVGGKGGSLGIMSNAGILIPPGFVITTEVYKKFFNLSIPPNIQDEILQAFDSLETERVAVRSSAVAEDSKNASWAGQLESYLNVSRDNLIKTVKKCWDSMKSERALSYASSNKFSEDELVIAVVVQEMVESEVSGVIFTKNPISKDKDQIMIEACYGLGEMLVQGLINPDNYVIHKKTLEILSKIMNNQNKMLVFKNGENKEVDVSQDKKGVQIISDDEIKILAKLAIQIEDYYGSPQDIEWALKKDKFYILQSRPVTTT